MIDRPDESISAKPALRLLATLLLAAGILPGCGKKGPPLAPLVKVPAAPQDVAARRTGDVVSVQLRVPAANSGGAQPADIERVDVYGFTGAPPAPAEVVKHGTLVASVPVRRPPVEGEDAEARGDGGKPRPPASMAHGFDQGDLVTVTEALGAAQRIPVDVKRRGRQPAPRPENEWLPVLRPAARPGRLYFAVGVNRKGERGEFTAPLPVPLGPAPSPPRAPKATYDAARIELTWAEPPDVPKPIQAPAAEGELESKPRGESGTIGGYNVYDVPPAAQGAADAAAALVQAAGVSKPLNDQLLEAPSFTDPRVEYGRERCYAVRTVSQSGAEVTESRSSETVCVTPVDTFPPPAPKSLAAVASEGAVSLIWEASADADLAGYVVLRAEAGGPPRAITPEPIKETTFRDATAARGARYAYTVVAIDNAGNRSAPSNTAEETAR